jgi:hypothetical protein
MTQSDYTGNTAHHNVFGAPSMIPSMFTQHRPEYPEQSPTPFADNNMDYSDVNVRLFDGQELRNMAEDAPHIHWPHPGSVAELERLKYSVIKEEHDSFDLVECEDSAMEETEDRDTPTPVAAASNIPAAPTYVLPPSLYFPPPSHLPFIALPPGKKAGRRSITSITFNAPNNGIITPKWLAEWRSSATSRSRAPVERPGENYRITTSDAVDALKPPFNEIDLETWQHIHYVNYQDLAARRPGADFAVNFNQATANSWDQCFDLGWLDRFGKPT